LARFFGFKISEVESMDSLTFQRHNKAMERLEAQELLTQLKVMDYPNMKDEARNKLHKSLTKKAFPVQKVYSFDEIENIFGGN
jgi:hypothetical protein